MSTPTPSSPPKANRHIAALERLRAVATEFAVAALTAHALAGDADPDDDETANRIGIEVVASLRVAARSPGIRQALAIALGAVPLTPASRPKEG